MVSRTVKSTCILRWVHASYVTKGVTGIDQSGCVTVFGIVPTQ